MNQPNRLAPVIYSTLTITLLSILPYVNYIQFVCCANAILGGIVAVNIYNKELANTAVILEYKDGIIMSVLSGVLSSIIVTGITIVATMLLDVNPMENMNLMLEQMQLPVTPESNNMIQHFSNEFDTYGFSPTLSIFQLISSVVLYSGFASIGAVIMISIIKKKNQNIDSFPVN